MKLEDWVNIGALKAFSIHLTGCIPAIGVYVLFKLVSGYFIHDPIPKILVEILEDGLLVTALGLLAWFTIRDLWKRGQSVLLFPQFLAT